MVTAPTIITNNNGLICLQPTLSRVYHNGLKSLLGNAHDQWMRKNPPWNEIDLVDDNNNNNNNNNNNFMLEPFLRNEIGIPCNNNKHNFIQMIEILETKELSMKWKQLCSSNSNTNDEKKQKLLNSRCMLLSSKYTKNEKIHHCHHDSFDFLFPIEKRFDIVTWSDALLNI